MRPLYHINSLLSLVFVLPVCGWLNQICEVVLLQYEQAPHLQFPLLNIALGFSSYRLCFVCSSFLMLSQSFFIFSDKQPIWFLWNRFSPCFLLIFFVASKYLTIYPLILNFFWAARRWRSKSDYQKKPKKTPYCCFISLVSMVIYQSHDWSMDNLRHRPDEGKIAENAGGEELCNAF